MLPVLFTKKVVRILDILWAVLIKKLIPLALVGYEKVIAGAHYFPSKESNRLLVIANSRLRALLAMFHIISNAHSWNNC